MCVVVYKLCTFLLIVCGSFLDLIRSESYRKGAGSYGVSLPSPFAQRCFEKLKRENRAKNRLPIPYVFLLGVKAHTSR
jgi:hypothetical protein